MDEYPEFSFETRDDWRSWLLVNHRSSRGIWLIYFKKGSGIPSISYNEAVEEALCFGWIDARVKSIDRFRYRQAFTPRRKNSLWSAQNISRVQNLIAAGKMTAAGFEKIDEAKRNGRWEGAYQMKKELPLPQDLKDELMLNPQAWENFLKFTQSYQSTYIYWVSMAKRPETRLNRISKVVDSCAKNIKPGIA